MIAKNKLREERTYVGTDPGQCPLADSVDFYFVCRSSEDLRNQGGDGRFTRDSIEIKMGFIELESPPLRTQRVLMSVRSQPRVSMRVVAASSLASGRYRVVLGIGATKAGSIIKFPPFP